MPDALVPLLTRRGPMTGGDLVRHLGVSRTALLRAVRAAGDAVVVRGRARRTTYAARRALRGMRQSLPVYRLDAQGQLAEVAALDLVEPQGCALQGAEALGWPLDEAMRDGWFAGLPYMLQDLRPQGFIGRHLARAHAALLQVPEDPTRWSDDDVLHAQSLLGADLPGDLIVGEPACRRWLESLAGDADRALDDAAVPAAFEALAVEAMAGGLPGSSAGGEFPKFTALRRVGGELRHVLVKFSGADDAPATQRWADLLVCEHLAAQVLREVVGLRAAGSRLHRAGGRTFLEVDRFDRHGERGRSGVVSWQAVNGDLVGSAGRPWPVAVQPLVARGWLSAADAEAVARLWWFGRLIGNTDMHDGNLSFERAGAGSNGAGLQPSPAYDMLPMGLAPGRGVEAPQALPPPARPLPAEREAWHAAARGAEVFWRQAAVDARIGEGFRRLAAMQAERLEAARRDEGG